MGCPSNGQSSNIVCAENELSPSYLSYEHSLVLHRCWSESLWSGRERDGAKGVAIIPPNPWKVVHLTQWDWKEISSSHCNDFLWGFPSWDGVALKRCPLFLAVSYHLQNAVLQILGGIITNNKNALDPCLTPPLETATLCSSVFSPPILSALLKGTDITLSHSPRRFDAQRRCAAAPAASFGKGLCLYHSCRLLTRWAVRVPKGEDARNNWLY